MQQHRIHRRCVLLHGVQAPHHGAQVVRGDADLGQAFQQAPIALGVGSRKGLGRIYGVAKLIEIQCGLAGKQQTGGQHDPRCAGQSEADLPELVEPSLGCGRKLLGGCLCRQTVHEQAVGVAVDRGVLEPQLTRGGRKVDELEMKFVGAAAELLQCRHLSGVRQDHCAQGDATRDLALRDEVLEYLRRIGGAGAADFVETMGSKLG